MKRKILVACIVALICMAIVLAFEYANVILSGATVRYESGGILPDYVNVHWWPLDLLDLGIVILMAAFIYFQWRRRRANKKGPRNLIRRGKADEKSGGHN